LVSNMTRYARIQAGAMLSYWHPIRTDAGPGFRG
jgi:hypothetical protein